MSHSSEQHHERNCDCSTRKHDLHNHHHYGYLLHEFDGLLDRTDLGHKCDHGKNHHECGECVRRVVPRYKLAYDHSDEHVWNNRNDIQHDHSDHSYPSVQHHNMCDHGNKSKECEECKQANSFNWQNQHQNLVNFNKNHKAIQGNLNNVSGYAGVMNPEDKYGSA